MDAKQAASLRSRLKTIEGHIRGIQRMLDEDAYCIDVITQTQAIQAALDKFNAELLENHMGTCVTTAIRGDDPAERERVLHELMTVFTAKRAKKSSSRGSKSFTGER